MPARKALKGERKNIYWQKDRVFTSWKKEVDLRQEKGVFGYRE